MEKCRTLFLEMVYSKVVKHEKRYILKVCASIGTLFYLLLRERDIPATCQI